MSFINVQKKPVIIVILISSLDLWFCFSFLLRAGSHYLDNFYFASGLDKKLCPFCFLIHFYFVCGPDEVPCHFCFKPKKVTDEVLRPANGRKSQMLISSIIILKTALDALPFLSKVRWLLHLAVLIYFVTTWGSSS